jgi:hypothetical protein
VVVVDKGDELRHPVSVNREAINALKIILLIIAPLIIENH